MALAMMALFGTIIILPLILQRALHLDPLNTVGLMLLPGGLLMGLLGPVTGRLFDRVGPRPLMLPASVVIAGVFWLLSTIQLSIAVVARGGGAHGDERLVRLHVHFCSPSPSARCPKTCIRTAQPSWAPCSRSPARSVRRCSSPPWRHSRRRRRRPAPRSRQLCRSAHGWRFWGRARGVTLAIIATLFIRVSELSGDEPTMHH